MHPGDADLHPSPPVAGTEQGEFRGVTLGGRFFLGITIAAVFAVLVVPLLIWAAGILAGG
jgi:hypothetical protein